ncbi:hypothetical protein GCM10022403_079360 [Streptomyces coacervatus]|uniref:Protein phosphatase n=1 Tax=Streptomyces coacervatus TaxID=647381 RepID=A0ABP7J4K3_9ACTN|nr:hypothetical protein [Streptomyces coacervatus]MDF2269328.1 hypothetical protein [Streptomyces coacervatus]
MGDEAKLIDPSGIPHFIGDLATLDTDVMLLTADAGQFRASGSDVHTEFQGLSAFYHAPEAEQLFATTLPVKQKSDAFADDLEKVTAALSDYSFEVQPLVQKLDALKADATAFVNALPAGDDWRKDQDKVDHNNDLWHDVNHAVAAFQAAERTAYNKIMALIGGAGLSADDGSHGKNMYGYRADDLDHAKETPWGAPVEREYEGWSWLVHQGKQVWDGVWHDGVIGTIHGLGTLFGSDGWGAAGEAWNNLAKLGTASFLTSSTLGAWWLVPDDQLPSWLRDARKVHNQAVKGFVAYDQWKTNPARAAGAFGFNVLTVAGTEGVGSAASGAGKAGAAARALSVAGKVGRAVDPMTYIGKVGKFAFVKVGDTFATLKNLHTGTYLDMANVADRYTPAEHPMPLAERPVSVPDSAIEYIDAKGDPVYLTEDGHVLNADGSVRQHADEAAHELSPADRSQLQAASSGNHESQLVGAHAGANSAGDAGHATGHATGGDARQVGDSAANVDTTGHGLDASGGADRGSGTAGHHGGGGGDVHGSDSGRELSPEEHKRIVEEQIHKVNADPDWRHKYYRKDGERRSIYAKDENGNFLPQIKEQPDGTWIAASDMPHGPQEGYLLRPQNVGPDSVPPHAEDELAEVTRVHHAHHELNVAEKAFEAAPTHENSHALEKAHAAFGDHPRNSKLGEALGTKASELHAIPKLFPDAEEVVLPRTPNGADEFDKIYRLKQADGHFLLVEDKAPDGRLGWRQGAGPYAHMRVKQGTLEYAQTIVELMERRGGKEAEVAAELRRAMRRKKVQYILIQANPHTGTYNGATVSYFKIFEES